MKDESSVQPLYESKLYTYSFTDLDEYLDFISDIDYIVEKYLGTNEVYSFTSYLDRSNVYVCELIIDRQCY